MSLYVPITFDAIPNLLSSGVSEGAIQSVLKRVASKFTREIQRSTPVDTGRLRRSIRVELLLDGMGVAVTSEIYYAGFVEFGTRKMRPRGFVESHVADLLTYGNSLLSELSGQRIQTNVRRRDNTDSLYTGDGVRSVSVVDFLRIRSLVVKDSIIQSSTVAGQQVLDLVVDSVSG